MKILHQGHQDYLKFFPASGHMENRIWVPSGFLLSRQTDDGMLLCNTLTGELVLLSAEERAWMDSLPAAAAPASEELIRGRFAVPEGCDEAKSADQLRGLLIRRQAAKKTFTSCNILPTTFCNAHCFYCYESGIRHVHMSQDTAEQLVQMIAGHYDGRQVTLLWFGGEPLVGMDRIDQICARLRELGIHYRSKMTSNAYLFDEDLVRKAKDLWNLQSIQITLDGTEEVYNRTKAYSGVRDNSYQRVLRNIRLLTDTGISVDIRMNLDRHNDKNLMELADELAARFRGCRYLTVYVRKLNSDEGFEPLRHAEGDAEYLDGQVIRIQEKLEQYGWRQYRADHLPSLTIASCMADNPHAIQCTPDGILSKCEDQIYGHTVGTLADGITDKEEVRYWQQRRAFDGCGQCPLYPSCDRLLRNCPVKTEKCTEYDKNRRISRYQEIMLQEYEKWKNKEQ